MMIQIRHGFRMSGEIESYRVICIINNYLLVAKINQLLLIIIIGFQLSFISQVFVAKWSHLTQNGVFS